MNFSPYNPRCNSLKPRVVAIFVKAFQHMVKFNLTGSYRSGLNSSWLPRNSRTAGQYIATMAITASMPRSQRLLSSLEDLRSDIVHGNQQLDTMASMWKVVNPHDFFEWPEEDLRQSRRRAWKVIVRTTDLTREFMIAHTSYDINQWYAYKVNCQRRHRWGEFLRSNMDWEWDTGSCLKRLFKIEQPLPCEEAAASIATVGSSSTQQEGDIAQVVIGGARTTMPKVIQVPYRDELGRNQYRTYHAAPSVEDVSISPDAVGRPAIHMFNEPTAEQSDIGGSKEAMSLDTSSLQRDCSGSEGERKNHGEVEGLEAGEDGAGDYMGQSGFEGRTTSSNNIDDSGDNGTEISDPQQLVRTLQFDQISICSLD